MFRTMSLTAALLTPIPHRVAPMRRIIALAAVALGLMSAAPGAHADFINPDFQTGDLTGWTSFTTANGTNGTSLPNVLSFNTTGGGASLAAHFRVGQVVFTSGMFAGGGILQSLNVADGNYVVSLDFAANNTSPTGINAQGGRIALLVDGVVQSPSFTSGFIAGGQTIRTHLDIPVSLTAGIHEFDFQITRNFLASDTTPEQYLDNIHISPVPAPPAVVLLGLGAGCVALQRYVVRRATA
jgi:hypothetical protein